MTDTSDGPRPGSGTAPSTASGGRPAPGVRLSLEDLGTLRRAILEVAGPDAPDEVLFHLGRAWGEREAERIGGEADLRTRLEAGLRWAERMHLGRIEIESMELDVPAEVCRVSGRVRDPLEMRMVRPTAPDAERPPCGLMVGYLTGLTARLTGLDVVCSPLGHEDGGACGFELRTAHHRPGSDNGRADGPPPVGSARFYLGAMGKALAVEDIALDDLLENTSDALVLIDSGDLIRFWNRGAEAMFGWTREEVVGRRVGFIVPRDLLEGDELGQLRRILEGGGTVQNWVTRRVHKEGRTLWVSLTRTVLHDRSGRVVGSTATIRDITAQRRTEEELARARGLAMLGELSAKIAHEIKNPLTGIYAAIQLLGRDLEPGDPRREVFEDLGAEIRRLDDTVQDLLRFARPLPPRPQPTDLRSFVHDLLVPLRLQPDVARHKLQLSIEEGLVLPLDARLMGQAVTNLLLNAAQAMEAPGVIAVVGVDGGDHVVLDVADSGPGIAADQREAVFEPFITSKVRGSGLGLSIARKNVEAHGGQLRLEEQEGPGARFRITLPRTREAR